MPFGLTNAPATCQQFVNDTLREFLDVFCAVYIDDISIYSNSKKEHVEQIRKVLQKLLEAGLYVKAGKCEFCVSQTTFLGFVISKDGVSMDPAKVKAIREWEPPTCVCDVQCFLGFANFYRWFIHRYSQKCRLPFLEVSGVMRHVTPCIYVASVFCSFLTINHHHHLHPTGYEPGCRINLKIF
jgi:hypothetical protein